jgi:hypothetical protein
MASDFMKFHTSVQDMRLRLSFLTPLAQTWFYMCHADTTFFLLDGVGRIKVESSCQGGLNTDTQPGKAGIEDLLMSLRSVLF